MHDLRKYSYVEGVGDEVIYGTIGALMAVFSVTYLWNQNHDRHQEIHPESENIVREVREQINDRTSTQQGAEDGEATNGHPATNDRRSDEPPRPHGNHVAAPGTVVQCPVCLSDARFAVDTNCGHSFCGSCIIAYWTHGRWLGAVSCPVCRQTVTVLLPRFTPQEQLDTGEENADMLAQINRYNRRFSGDPRAWLDYIYDLPTLLRHCVTELFTVGGLFHMFRLRVLLCFGFAVIYLLSPLDIIPEAVFGILGLLDDIFIVLMLGIYITVIYRNAIYQRAQQQAQ